MGSRYNKGINDSGLSYYKVTKAQDLMREFSITEFFLNLIKREFRHYKQGRKSIDFINYGDMELVYILKLADEQYTLLVGQPWNKKGVLKQEYENLKVLNACFPNYFPAPLFYIPFYSKEAYATEYFMQARCIVSDEFSWGMYVPEPNYHFCEFNSKQRELIIPCMIALLVITYDEDTETGIADCRFGGGDFILLKGFEKEILKEDKIMNNLKMVAARKVINVPFEEYLNLIRTEFVKNTYYKEEKQRDPKIIINVKNRQPLTAEDIEKGIALGLSLRKEPLRL